LASAAVRQGLHLGDQYDGCVAEASSTVAPNRSVSTRSADRTGSSSRSGSAWTSSSTITDPASR
jgi:hypothetical protein